MKGQVTIAGIIMGLGAMALTAFGFYAASNVRTDNKIGTVQKETTTVSERVARLETAVPNIEKDIGIIRDDLRDIKKALNIK